MTSKRGRYKNVRTRAAEGADLLVVPLDYIILSKLPKEGTLMGGIVPIGETVRNLLRTEFEGLLTSEQVSGRLSAMQAMGYTTLVNMPARQKGGNGWQITKLGQRKLEEWAAGRNGTEGSES